MITEALYETFGKSSELQKRAIFANIFVVQNRLQTACDELEEEITMKQWLLLAMVSVFPVPPTLTALGESMGCSRQNVKKLAAALEKKGYLYIRQSEIKASAAEIILSEKAKAYENNSKELHEEVLQLLFQDFNEKEISTFYNYIKKLYSGLVRIEKMTESERNNENEET